MDIIDGYEDIVHRGDDILDKMRRVSIIEDAAEELETGLELHPDTEAELESIGIPPGEFIRRFQETSQTG